MQQTDRRVMDVRAPTCKRLSFRERVDGGGVDPKEQICGEACAMQASGPITRLVDLDELDERPLQVSRQIRKLLLGCELCKHSLSFPRDVSEETCTGPEADTDAGPDTGTR